MNYSTMLTNTPINDPMKELRKFIGVYWGSDLDNDTIIRLMKSSTQEQKNFITKGVQAAKIVLSEDKYNEELVKVILWEANQPLTEPLIDNARNWLREKILFTEETIGSVK